MSESQSKLERWTKTLSLAGAVLTFAGAVAGGIWAIYTYDDAKKKEFYTAFWNKKMELFVRTANAASKMATTSSLVTFNNARAEYWEMFYGPLSLVEGSCVKRAMQVFSQCVPDKPLTSPDKLPLSYLQQPSYRLAIRLKDELARSWQSPFSELTDSTNKCGYEDDLECIAARLRL